VPVGSDAVGWAERETVAAQTSEPILQISKLNKSFGPVHVLQDVDFNVYPGQVTALVGMRSILTPQQRAKLRRPSEARWH